MDPRERERSLLFLFMSFSISFLYVSLFPFMSLFLSWRSASLLLCLSQMNFFQVCLSRPSCLSFLSLIVLSFAPTHYSNVIPLFHIEQCKGIVTILSHAYFQMRQFFCCVTRQTGQGRVEARGGDYPTAKRKMHHLSSMHVASAQLAAQLLVSQKNRRTTARHTRQCVFTTLGVYVEGRDRTFVGTCTAFVVLNEQLKF